MSASACRRQTGTGPEASYSATDKAAGMAYEAAGKVKQGVGKAVGAEKLQGEGAGQEAKGDAQQLKGDAKNAVKAGVNKVADTANKKL